jgi:large subunit ribosomal protein L23
MKSARQIVIRPLITEKTTHLRDEANQYAFQVHIRANKIEIRRAVEETFDVKVENVRTSWMHGKVKQLGRFRGKRPDWKKAVVTLRQGDTIEFFEGT